MSKNILTNPDPEQRCREYAQQTGATNLVTAENVLLFNNMKPVFNDSSSFGVEDIKYANTNRRAAFYYKTARVSNDLYDLKGNDSESSLMVKKKINWSM